MRTRTQLIILCALLSATSACVDRVTDPAVVDGNSGVVLAASGATQESGYGVFVGEGINYLDCLGEDVHTHAEFPFRWHQTVTPSGNVAFRDAFVAGGSARLEGLSSGNVWTAEHYVSPEVINTNAGQEAFFVAIVRWVSPTAPTFTIHNTLHFVQNANSEVTVNRVTSRCIVR
jgi:hypothetical protein